MVKAKFLESGSVSALLKENGREKAKKIYRESAAVIIVDEAAVVDNEAAVVVDEAANVVDGAATVVVAAVGTDRAVDKSDVLAPSCELGLNLNLSLNFNREGIFYYDLCQKSCYLELFSQYR